MSKILVIEDEATTRDMIADCLESEGFSVVEANNGRSGVEQAHIHQPDLVLCDIVLPKLDGYGVLSALRKSIVTATIPFIFVSAKNDRLAQRQGMALGADDYLSKPFTTVELVEAIAARLRSRNLLKQLYTAAKNVSEPSKKVPIPREQEPEALTKTPIPFQFPEHRQLQEIFAFVEENYPQPIGLNEIAKAFGYSPSYLTSLVRRLTGQTLYQWIVQRRMFQARHLLLETELTVHKVAEIVGYVDTGHFVKHFRKVHKQPPKTWRDAQRAGDPLESLS